MNHSTTSTITATPSDYDGLRMRSRLEADWAAFLDEHGVTWAYEPERYTLGKAVYVPDFWCPDIRTIIEVKGAFENERDFKALTFAYEAAKQDVLMIFGEAPAGRSFSVVHPTPQEVAYPGASGKASWSLVDRATFFGCCADCGSWQFGESAMGWDCRVCGHYAGAATYSEFYYPSGPR